MTSDESIRASVRTGEVSGLFSVAHDKTDDNSRQLRGKKRNQPARKMAKAQPTGQQDEDLPEASQQTISDDHIDFLA